MDAIWGFRFGRRTGWTAPDRDFAPLFNFVGQPADVEKPVEAKPAPKPGVTQRVQTAMKSAVDRPAKQPTRTHSKPANASRAVTPAVPAKPDGDRVRAWIDLEELAGGIVRRDGRIPTAADAADWLLRLNFVFDGEAWSCDREDLRLIGNFGVLKVRREV
jgi:hypothetical protein